MLTLDCSWIHPIRYCDIVVGETAKGAMLKKDCPSNFVQVTERRATVAN